MYCRISSFMFSVVMCSIPESIRFGDLIFVLERTKTNREVYAADIVQDLLHNADALFPVAEVNKLPSRMEDQSEPRH